MNICVYSNPPYALTGYGQQTAILTKRLKNDGHDIVVSPNCGCLAITDWNGIKVLPEGLVPHSADIVPDNIRNFVGGDGFGLLLHDLWPIDGSTGWRGLNLACWVPVDHNPCPLKTLNFLNGHHVIAMSRFGQEMLFEAGVPEYELTYIPHSFESSTFYDRGMNMRQDMGIPEDAFLVVTNAANRGCMPCRKGFGEMFEAMSRLMEDRKDVYWMLHTEPFGYQQGINLPRLANKLKMDTDRLYYPDKMRYRSGMSNEYLANIYSISDCILALSMGEGFGIPSSIEAPACGTPAIVSDFSAQPEFLTPHGKKVKVQRYWNEPMGSWFGIAIVDDAYNKLQEMYEETKAGKVDRKAVSAAVAHYEADSVFDHCWRPLVQKMGERCKKP
jgi:glycosyltransferase involved in cell wall biosynthesis